VLVDIFIIIAVWLFGSYEFGYNWGQIDCLTGKIKYELVSHPDSTKSWVEKKGK